MDWQEQLAHVLDNAVEGVRAYPDLAPPAANNVTGTIVWRQVSETWEAAFDGLMPSSVTADVDIRATERARVNAIRAVVQPALGRSGLMSDIVSVTALYDDETSIRRLILTIRVNIASGYRIPEDV